MLSMKIFFQILIVWQENDLVFSSEFEKNSIKDNNIKIAPCLIHTRVRAHALSHTHTHTLTKIQHAKSSMNGSQGKGTHIFYKTINLCDCRFHCRRLMFWLFSLRYTYVLKIHVCTYSMYLGWSDSSSIIRNAYFPRYGNYKTKGIYFWCGEFHRWVNTRTMQPDKPISKCICPGVELS